MNPERAQFCYCRLNFLPVITCLYTARTGERRSYRQRTLKTASIFALRRASMAEGALEVEAMSGSSGATGSGVTGGGGGGDLTAAQLEGQLDLHVDGNRSELLLVEAGVASGGGQSIAATGDDDVLVAEPVLGMRMLMSSRVSTT